ncbi:hypothetical protein [Spiroplasma endosymbiont of Amphimallon solstitiale]
MYHYFSTKLKDNPDNPKTVFLNLPISWDSQGGKLNVTFDEKSL